MSRLPVIVGFGGYNAAGRSSFHHGFRRMVIESMDPQARQETLAGLAVMMKLVKAEGGRYLAEDGTPLSPEDIERRYAERIFASTLVRRIETAVPRPGCSPLAQGPRAVPCRRPGADLQGLAQATARAAAGQLVDRSRGGRRGAGEHPRALRVQGGQLPCADGEVRRPVAHRFSNRASCTTRASTREACRCRWSPRPTRSAPPASTGRPSSTTSSPTRSRYSPAAS
ncbi:putative beta-ketoacyl synthase [Pseudomonas aeruginosa]|nr:putative beta-ketoacyl synthase [Pseudomonas aeruginosa]